MAVEATEMHDDPLGLEIGNWSWVFLTAVPAHSVQQMSGLNATRMTGDFAAITAAGLAANPPSSNAILYVADNIALTGVTGAPHAIALVNDTAANINAGTSTTARVVCHMELNEGNGAISPAPSSQAFNYTLTTGFLRITQAARD